MSIATPTEVEVCGNRYRIGRLGTIQQWHVARRILPIAMAMAAAATAEGDREKDDVVGVFLPVAEAFSKMSDADTEYVLNTCLAVCHREHGEGAWQKVMPVPGRFQYEDIDMKAMVQLTAAVIKEHRLADFMYGLQDAPP